MFSPPDDKVNFLDGTLCLLREGLDFRFNFKPHSKDDFITTMVKAKYRTYLDSPNVVNDKFQEWLLTYLGDDEGAYNLIQEMFGASQMPRFPQFFVLVGESSTGKSTCMKVLLRMHDKAKYIGRLEPHKFEKFNLRSLIGKKINIVMDIATDVKISDNIVKQIADRIPLLVERKTIDDVEALMPAVHIFGANKMPTTKEGYSGSMKRRFTIINFDTVHKGKVFDGIADYLFDHSPQGVFNFALNGLLRLVNDNQGKYTQTEKSMLNAEKWTSREDLISLFLKSFKEDGAVNLGGKPIIIVKKEGLEIAKFELWKVFEKWQEGAVAQRNWNGRNTFYGMMSDRGYVSKHKESGNFYQGIGVDSESQLDDSI